MGSFSDGHVDNEDATNGLALSVSQPVSQSCSDRFDVDGKSAALESGREISGQRRRRQAGGGGGGGGGEEGGLYSRIWLMTVKCSGKLVQRRRRHSRTAKQRLPAVHRVEQPHCLKPPLHCTRCKFHAISWGETCPAVVFCGGHFIKDIQC